MSSSKKRRVEASTDGDDDGDDAKQVRVWMDGCFDMFHWGHANALRQGKKLGTYLIVGVHDDAEVRFNKGPPVLSEEERYEAVEACKWVDKVVRGAPYTTSLEVLREHNVDIVIHGDDIVLNAEGEDSYTAIRKAGMFRTIPRTIGVSTTDLVGRMLLCTKNHHLRDDEAGAASGEGSMAEAATDHRGKSPYTRMSKFVPSTKKIVQFSSEREPKEGDTIVYVDGAFDLFHIGHVQFLRAARALGDYLIVGILPDQVVNSYKGSNYPIQNLQERTLGVLACRYVDEVIIGAPWSCSEQVIRDLNISIVAQGTTQEEIAAQQFNADVDAYADAKRLGKYRAVDSPSSLTTDTLIERIINNRKLFIERNRKKEEREVKHLAKMGQK